MWGVLIVGVIASAVGAALYEWLRTPAPKRAELPSGPPALALTPAAATAAAPAVAPASAAAASPAVAEQMRNPLPPHNPAALDTPKLQQRAAYCQLQVTDWVAANVWVKQYNFPLSMLDTLKMLYTANPGVWNTWPPSVRRVYCTYLGG